MSESVAAAELMARVTVPALRTLAETKSAPHEADERALALEAAELIVRLLKIVRATVDPDDRNIIGTEAWRESAIADWFDVSVRGESYEVEMKGDGKSYRHRAIYPDPRIGHDLARGPWLPGKPPARRP